MCVYLVWFQFIAHPNCQQQNNPAGIYPGFKSQRYHLESKLGEGGFGVVIRAQDSVYDMQPTG